MDLIPLQYLPSGQRGLVEQLSGSVEHVRRLHEMGFCDGAEVEMLQPGTPCIVRLGRQRLCLRADEFTTVLIRIGE